MFIAQALSWAGVPAIGAAAAGAAGVLASQGTVHLWAVLVVGTAGAEVGSMGGWWLGHHVARAGNTEGRFAEKRKKALDAGGKVEAKWGRLIVFFVPSWVSGALGMPARQFAFWNFFAAALWNLGAALASYGVASAASGKPASHVVVPIAIAVIAGGAIVWILRNIRRRRLQRTEPAPLVPDG